MLPASLEVNSHRRTVTVWLLAWIFQCLIQHGATTRSVSCSNYALLSTGRPPVFRSWAHSLGFLHCCFPWPVAGFFSTSTPALRSLPINLLEIGSKSSKVTWDKCIHIGPVFPRSQIKVKSQAFHLKCWYSAGGVMMNSETEGQRLYSAQGNHPLLSHSVICSLSSSPLYSIRELLTSFYSCEHIILL